jgi:hypothetical protein
LILLPAVFNLGIIAYYSSDVQSFVESYCVNKDKPELECNGKCFLTKNYNQSQNNTKGELLALINGKSLVFLNETFGLFLLIPSSNPNACFIHPNFHSLLITLSIDQPPQLA